MYIHWDTSLPPLSQRDGPSYLGGPGTRQSHRQTGEGDPYPLETFACQSETERDELQTI